jgi:alpha-soluble NSF attachment protein
MSELKGDSFVAEAEKKLKSWSLFGSGSKTEAAQELYDKAATQYKLAKEWDKAGEAYTKVAEFAEKLGDKFQATNAYLNAAQAYKHTSPKDAIKLFEIASDMHAEENRMPSAAKLQKEIAQLEEKEDNVKGALQAYQKAAELFEAGNAVAAGNGMLLKVAELSTREKDYARAVEIYEKVIETSLENSMLSHSVKDYMFKAGLCTFVMAAKSEEARLISNKLDQYEDQHPAFGNDRNGQLLRNLVEAFETDNVQKFTDDLFKYDRISPLSNDLTSMFLDIKNVMTSSQLATADNNTGGDDENNGGEDEDDDLR